MADKLRELAQLFSADKPLYAVGGYVRDKLLGLVCHDIDVCSQLTVDEVKKLLLTSDFVVSDKNLRVGTVAICTRGFRTEYTAFRTDSYPDNGQHTPTQVRFTTDIFLDAARRDFGCNAIYYDIVADEIVDPLGRVNEVKERIIRTADVADKVFSADGLRILRMVRFAAELGFEIDAQTFESAKKYAHLVRDISAERIMAELDRILTADTARKELKLCSAHVRGIELLDQLGLIDELLPELSALKGLSQNARYHLYDAYTHSLKCFEASPPHLRWATLLHDIGKRTCWEKDGNMRLHSSVGAELAKERLTALKMPKARLRRVVDLIAAHMVNVNGDMSENKLRWFVAERASIAEDLAELKDCDAIGAMGNPLPNNDIRRVYAELISTGAPLSVKDLKVGGEDLIQLDIDEKNRGIILYELWRDTVMNPQLNTREKALNYLARRSNR